MAENRSASEQPLTPLPVVLGPTGSGKSDLSLLIAHAAHGEIVNFDSVQVYRGFDIGTAKLSSPERQGIAHHLIDILDPAALFTAGDYARLAAETIRQIAARGRIPVLAGGTGFYLRALLHGLSPGPPRSETLRARLQEREAMRPGALHRILSRLDPVSAGRIHPNDKNKTLRALEIRLLAGAPLSSIFEQERHPLSGFAPIKIGLNPPRELLYKRLNERTLRMFIPDSNHTSTSRETLLDEVRRLLAAGVPRSAKPFESLGYRQALDAIEGKITEAQAIESTQQETRRYAKRQQTWFRKEQDVHWIPGFGDDPEVQAQALEILRRAGVV